MPELLEQQFLTFSLKGEKYAIPVGRVFEVLEYGKITRLPCAETYLKGLINLRGQGVPVLDLALRFGLPETGSTRDTAIIVVELDREEEATIVGLIADAVHEVVELDSSGIEAAPKFGVGPAQDFLKGVCRKDEGFVLILDIDRLFVAEEVRVPEEAEAAED